LSGAIVFVLGLTVCLAIGAAVAGGRPRRRQLPAGVQLPWNRQFPESLHRQISLVCLVPAYLSVHLLLSDLGQGYEVFTSFERLVASAAAASIARYRDDFNPAALTRVLTSFVFLAAFIVGWYATRPDALRRWWMLAASFVPALAWTVLLTTKANVLLWLVFALAAFLVYRDPSARAAWLGWRSAWMTLGGVIFTGLLFGVQVARYGGDVAEEAGHVGEGLVVSAVGHSFALRDWFEKSANWFPIAFGSRSVAGAFELAGLAEREIGLYPDQNVTVGESFTNVYSALRSLIEDFGIPLACAQFVLFGWIGAVLERRSSAAGRACLAVQVGWILWSPITSIFNYNSIFLACGLFALLALTFANTPRRRRPCPASS
jgi:hypothetical protein